jgi:hypothetical protein
MSATPPGWEGILEAGEEVLWQGRPDGTLSVHLSDAVQGFFGFVFTGFALFWIFLAASSGGFFWVFGLIPLGVGLGMSIGGPLWRAYRLRHTWYTLTTQRAFIATDNPVSGRNLMAYPVTPESPLKLVEANPGSVHFAETTRRNKNGTFTVPVGFERIHDARDVFAQMRAIQKEAK